jgi:glucosyl-dolichyl phosphate glucuronosyltransferase
LHHPKITVVICTYNRANLLESALQSLAKQTIDRSQYEVLVVNNNSTDSTQNVAESYANLNNNFRVVFETEQGLSHARNRGWKEARGEYVAYIDDDAKATPDWCERILRAFQTVSPLPVAVGGEIHPLYESPPPVWFKDDFEIRTWGKEAGFLEQPRAMYGFSGSNMAFPKTVLEQFGGFSVDFGMAGKRMRLGEETELFFRINEKYPRLWYDPAIRVNHWTPTRNMQASYLFWRSYRAGEAIARMQGQRFSLIGLIRDIIDILSILLKALPSVVKAQGNHKNKLVRELRGLGFQLGFTCAKLYL